MLSRNVVFMQLTAKALSKFSENESENKQTIWKKEHFPIIFLIILSHNLFSNVHVHMFIFSLTHGRLQLTLWVKF